MRQKALRELKDYEEDSLGQKVGGGAQGDRSSRSTNCLFSSPSDTFGSENGLGEMPLMFQGRWYNERKSE